MRYEILLAPEAVEDLQGLKANVRAEVEDAIEGHLRHDATKVSKSRIKKLRGLSRHNIGCGSEMKSGFSTMSLDTRWNYWPCRKV